MHHYAPAPTYGYGFATVDYGSDLLVPPPPLLPLMAIGMYPDGILVLLLLLMLMGKKVVLVRCIYLYEMLSMLLSPPMPLPLPSMSMDPAIRLEQRNDGAGSRLLFGPTGSLSGNEYTFWVLDSFGPWCRYKKALCDLSMGERSRGTFCGGALNSCYISIRLVD